ncbi:hypothetical protein LIER_27046 [Lithospermum erythrorhizon]|uniref:Uncharacterized protein n=1 Tax=Lithospermum erythrorhizon TaxID=34254 RepID=A0AAV3RC84_LITER
MATDNYATSLDPLEKNDRTQTEKGHLVEQVDQHMHAPDTILFIQHTIEVLLLLISPLHGRQVNISLLKISPNSSIKPSAPPLQCKTKEPNPQC